MRDCTRQASGCRVVQIAGVASELAMPFAGLHQLCLPFLTDLGRLPEPQQRALDVAFGLAMGNPPDHFIVGLATLGLLSEVAGQTPLVCLVDDCQWLDEATRLVLGFVGRRLLAESVLLLLGVRELDDELLCAALPRLTLDGLAVEDAGALLEATVAGQLDEKVRNRIIEETRGNPLGLLELPRGMTHAELAGGFGLPPTDTISDYMHEHYARRVRALPEPTRRLMLLAAADPTGDATLLWAAARELRIPRGAADTATYGHLLDVGSRVRFHHPLVRSAAYAAATREDRAASHLALAAATDVTTEPERRVWHLAAAAFEPDESIASALEQSAATARARAGSAAAAAFLQRSAALTAQPERRAERAL